MKLDQKLTEAGQAAGWLCRLCGRKVVTQSRPDHSLSPTLLIREGHPTLFVHLRCAKRETEKEPENMKSSDVRQTMHSLQEAAAARTELATISDLISTVDGCKPGPLSSRVATILEAFLLLKEAAAAEGKRKENAEATALIAERKRAHTLSTELALVKEQLQELVVQRDMLLRKVNTWDKEAKKLAYIQTAIKVATGLEELPPDA